MDYKTEKLISYMFNQISYINGCLAIMETELDSGTCIDINSIKHLKEFLIHTSNNLHQARNDLENSCNEAKE